MISPDDEEHSHKMPSKIKWIFSPQIHVEVVYGQVVEPQLARAVYGFLYRREGVNSAEYEIDMIKPSHVEVAGLPRISVPLFLLSSKTSPPAAIFPP